MAPKIFWLAVFLALFWGACLLWTAWRALAARRAGPAADRDRASGWTFILAVTVAGFAGWTLVGHPEMIQRDGFQYATVSLAAVAIPLAGLLFFKRLWILGRRFGQATPGGLLAGYFDGQAIRVLTVAVAVLFSVFFLAVQLTASGHLFEILTDGIVGRQWGMWIVALALVASTVTGGLRDMVSAAAVLGVLLALGIVIVGLVVLDASGGWATLQGSLAGIGENADDGRWGATMGFGGGDYNGYLAIPGVIQFTVGLDREIPVGGPWTGIMTLTFTMALMGLMSAPGFAAWAMASRDPRPFAPQQVWASSLGVGLVLVLVTAVLAMVGRFAGIWEAGEQPDSLVAIYFNLLADGAPLVAGLLTALALASIQGAGAFCLTTLAKVLEHDLIRCHPLSGAWPIVSRLSSRLGALAVLALGLLVATVSDQSPVFLAATAAAYGLQMWVPLAAVTWLPSITRQGATWGLLAGIVAVFLTDGIDPAVVEGFGIAPWCQWPWTIHSAGWGLLFNVVVCVIVSAITQDRGEVAGRLAHHRFLSDRAGPSESRRELMPVAWILVMVWIFFGIGPGAVIGNDIFGQPDIGVAGWVFSMPSIWAWQVLFWLLGVGMMWFLAYRMEMSTPPREEIVPAAEEAGKGHGGALT